MREAACRRAKSKYLEYFGIKGIWEEGALAGGERGKCGI